MTNKKIIFFDIDRTLYDPDTRSIPKSTIEALKVLNEDETVEIAIATGRAFYMLHIIEEIKQYINIFILINGQIILKDGKTIFRNPMEKILVKNVVDTFNEESLRYGFLGEFDETLNIVDDKGKKAFELINMHLPRIDPHFYQDNDIFQMWAFCEKERHTEFREKLVGLDVISWLGDGFDVLTGGMSKKEGIKKILEIEGSPLKDAYAFGDGDNDIEMMDFIENSVSMGNSTKECIKHATYITDDIKEDGVLKGLIKLGFIDDKKIKL